LFNLLGCYPENRENLNHYPNDYIHHLWGRRHFYIDLEASEKHLNALKDVYENVLACPSIFSRLRGVGVTMAPTKTIRRIRTVRRTPIPENITVAGENTCQMNMSVHVSDKFSPEVYQTSARSECGRKSIEDVDGGIKPS
jgi:hypothetical protein